MEYCEFYTLHHSQNGYVVRCKHCKNYQIAFGNLLLTFNAEEYNEFVQYLVRQFKSLALIDEREQKVFQVPTDSVKISMVFSTQEVEDLIDLLQQGQLMHQVIDFLNN